MNLEKVYKKNQKKIIFEKSKNQSSKIINFLTNFKKENFYSKKTFYKNYLDWLSKTLKLSILNIRNEIFKYLFIKKNSKILIIGCGYGDEIVYLIKKFKISNRVYAQDFSREMILESDKLCKNYNVSFSISDASDLPYKNNIFDFVIQVGGFNQFINKKKSINEMCRVGKENSTVFICDEGVGPWLKKTDIYKALVNNNQLWSFEPPINLIPYNAQDIQVGWILRNCFYFLKFKKTTKLNKININVKHKSPKGGSIKTRFEKKFSRKIKY